MEPLGVDADGKPHYEILLSLRNIGGEPVSSEHFMRAAERSNQVKQVDRRVIRLASVDFVKIDGMFVKELESNPSDYAMIKSITEIGRFLGKNH